MKGPSFFKNPHYNFGSGYLFFFFFSWSLWWSLYAIWLKENIHLTGEQLGSVYAVNQATSIIFTMLYGFFQDRLGLKKNLIWFLSGILILTGPFLGYLYEPLLRNHFTFALILGSIFIGAGYIGGVGLLDSFVEKMSRSYDFEYGTARAWGSLGYAIGAFITGYFFVINPHYVFWLASFLGVAFFVINMVYKTDDSYNVVSDAPKLISADFATIFKNMQFWFFVFFVTGTWAFYTIYDQQMFPNFYTELFTTTEHGTRVYGYLNSVQVLLEAVCMVLSPLVVYKIGAKKALILGSFIMFSRILGTAFLTDIYLVSGLKLLHAFAMPLFMIAVFKYGVANFDPRLSSTVFLIAFQLASSLAIVVLSTPIGVFVDLYDYSYTFLLFFAIGVVVLLFGLFFLNKTGLNHYDDDVKP